MLRLSERLRSDGYRTLNFGYPSRHFSIGHLASLLREFIRTEIPEAKTVHFVTHSLGGIVVQRYLATFPGEIVGGRVIMLGPPNGGSASARIVKKIPLIRALFGPVLNEVAELIPGAVPAGFQIGIIAGGTGRTRGFSPFISGDNDGIVTVEETRLPEAEFYLFKGGIHAILMTYPEVRHLVRRFLEDGSFSTDKST